MPTCQLCNAKSTLFYKDEFYKCSCCKAIFRPKEKLLDNEKEKQRYDSHTNDANDLGYQNFVKPITNSILNEFKSADIGLDFGCGKDSPIVKILEENSYKIAKYDIFFYDDIKDWSLSNGKFTLSIPKGFKSHNYFNLHKFNSSTHTLRISELLNESPILRQSYVPFEKMSITEILFEMWKKYDALPDLNLVQGLYDEFYELSGSFSMDIFFIYSIAMHIEKLEYRNLDGFMQDLYMARNLSKPISESLNIHNPEEIKYINSDWAIVYSRLKFGQVQVTYDGIDYKGLYCYIGDSEDHVEALLFDNGDYLCFGQRKFFSD